MAMLADRSAVGERGQLLPLFALMLPLLLLPVTALAVDGGVLLTSHANLVATAQAAAEAGSQAVDVTALASTGQFQLCLVPQGGASCGNGVGTVAQVVSSAVDAGLPVAGRACALVAAGSLSPAPGHPAGCELVLRTRCQDIGGVAGLDDGIEVLVWRTESMPLLALGPWAHLVVQATATAWLAHGYLQPVQSGSTMGPPC